MKIFGYLIFLTGFLYHLEIYSQQNEEFLILYYPFDNQICTDYSGNNNHGIPVNNPTYVIDGISGKAIHFEGKGYYIAINDDISEIGSHVLLPKIDFNKLDEFTISLWVRFKDFSHWPSGEAYIFWGHHNNGWLGVFNHIFEYQMNGKMINSFAVGAKLWNNLVEEDFQESFKNKWVHYALVYSKGNVKGYLNGNFIGQISQQVSIIGTNAALARHWWFYDGEERTSARFTGDMDEVKIFRKALSQEEIYDEMILCDFSTIKTLPFDSTNYATTNVRSITISNISKQVQIIEEVKLKKNLSFSVPQSQFPIIIQPQQNAFLIICFNPDTLGLIKDTLLLEDICGTQSIILTGYGKPNNFEGSSNCNLTISALTDEIVKNYLNSKIQIYPHEESIKGIINLTKNPPINELTLHIYNYMGNLIKKEKILIDINEIDNQSIANFKYNLSFLLPSAYFIIIDYDSNIKTIKFIKL